jgi:hypothetical protein
MFIELNRFLTRNQPAVQQQAPKQDHRIPTEPGFQLSAVGKLRRIMSMKLMTRMKKKKIFKKLRPRPYQKGMESGRRLMS